MKKIFSICCFLLPFLLPAQQPPCTLLKNIETGQDIPIMNYAYSLLQAENKLFFIGTTCTESPEVYTLNIGQDSAYLPHNAWPEARYFYWCNVPYPTFDHFPHLYLTAVGNRVFYILMGGQFGVELWTTDGTAEGSGLVRDIFQGSESSSPEQLTAFRNELWFTADDGVNGRELWRSDGTPEGTQMMLDIAPGAAGSRPLHLRTTGDELFFVAATTGDSSWLWRSDGTSEGTIPWLSLAAIPEGYMVESLQVAGGLLFLVAYNQSAKKANLYVANAQSNTLDLIIEEARASNSLDIPKEFTEWGGMVYFAASTQAHGRELWRTDGTVAGTTLFKDINPGANGSNPSDLQRFGNKIYFRTKIGNSEILYSTDGTPESTGPAALSPLPTSGINKIKAGDGQLFFTSGDQRELWRTDGIETERIFGPHYQNQWEFMPVAGGSVYFRVAQNGLWKWNGTPGTMAAPISTLGNNDGNSSPTAYFPMGNDIYISTTNALGRAKIWRSNGTPEGTIQAAFVNTQDTLTLSTVFALADSMLVFMMSTPAASRELWASNGQPGQERKVTDLIPGTYSYGVPDGRLVYLGNMNQRLYRTDGTAAGTMELISGVGVPLEALVFNGHTYLRMTNSRNRRLKTDGTPAGTTVLLTDTVVVDERFYFGHTMKVLDGRVWMIIKGGDNRWGLWRTNDDASAIELVVSFNPVLGDAQSPFLSTNGNHLYFFANDDFNTLQYYQSDGTIAGTRPFLDANVSVRPTGIRNTHLFWRNKLYYTSNSPEYGPELFVSDGTAEGTYVLADILPGVHGSDPFQLGPAFTDSLLFFTAFTPQHGRELWQTDGTPEGTFMVQDICPGPCSSSPDQLNIIGDGTLLFSAYHPGVGIEPWIYRFAAGPSTETEEIYSPSLERLLVFPNPNAGERFYVSLPEMRGSHRIEILDLRGVVLASERIAGAGRRVHEMTLPGLSNGMYLLRLLDADGRLRAVEKLMVIGR